MELFASFFVCFWSRAVYWRKCDCVCVGCEVNMSLIVIFESDSGRYLGQYGSVRRRLRVTLQQSSEVFPEVSDPSVGRLEPLDGRRLQYAQYFRRF